MLSNHWLDVHPADRSALLLDVCCGSDTDALRMAVSGEVDGLNVGQLQQAVIGALRHHQPSRIEMDLDGVTFLDSAGIRALLLCHAEAQQVDCKLTVTRPRPMVYRVLAITGLLEHLGITDPHQLDEP